MFKKVYNSILVVPDLHLPAHHKDAFSFLRAVKAKYNPDAVVFMGDILDFHSISYHEHDPDLPNPSSELDIVRKQIKELYELFPSAYCIYGNHDKLIHRKSTTAGLPKAAVKELSEILCSPTSWLWSSDLKLDTPRGPIYFTHGRTQSINKLAQMMGLSSVQTHYHSKFYISFIATPDRLFFDMNCGCLIDKDHRAFLYGEQCIGKPILGCGVISKGIPKLIPMLLKKRGKWNRQI